MTNPAAPGGPAGQAPIDHNEIILDAWTLAIDLHNLLQVTDTYLPDVFPSQMSPEVTRAFEQASALVAACLMMACKLKECLGNVS